MDRRLLIAVPALAVVAVLALTFLAEDRESPWPDDGSAYEERTVDAYMYGGTEGRKESMDLRYYADMPNVPYAGLTDYYLKLQGAEMSIRHDGDGAFTVTNPKPGAVAARIDLVGGTLSSEDLHSFAMVSTGSEEGSPDLPVIRQGTEEVVAEAAPVSVRFGDYGIKGHPDGAGREIWLPLQTLADIFYNGSNYYAEYVGSAVYFSYAENVMAGTYVADEGYVTKLFDFIGTGERPADLADYAYSELCFLFDNFFGNPGSGIISEDLRANGLDHALRTHSDDTRRIREYLRSSDAAEYYAGVSALGDCLYDGGHTDTGFMDLLVITRYAIGDPQFMQRFTGARESVGSFEPPDVDAIGESLKALREKAWSGWTEIGEGSRYIRSGDTAVLSFDGFDQDVEGWNRYMSEGGEMPEDTIGSFHRALSMASADAGVRNLVLDLTTNGGGYVAVAGYLYSAITGKDLVLDTLDTVTGKVSREAFLYDVNLDGAFDGKDHEGPRGLNIGVLTSTFSFSSANYLPMALKEAGVAVLGERSGGGICNLIQAATADGIIFTTSGYSRSIIGYGEPGYDPMGVERGAEPDVVLVTTGADGAADYGGLYDLGRICEGMDGFYAAARADRTHEVRGLPGLEAVVRYRYRMPSPRGCDARSCGHGTDGNQT